jgi:hypothetical protein
MTLNIGESVAWGAGIGALAACVVVLIGAILQDFFDWGSNGVAGCFFRNIKKPLVAFVVIGAVAGFLMDNIR